MGQSMSRSMDKLTHNNYSEGTPILNNHNFKNLTENELVVMLNNGLITIDQYLIQYAKINNMDILNQIIENKQKNFSIHSNSDDDDDMERYLHEIDFVK